MINFRTVKSKNDKYWLLIVTVIFILLGSFVIYISLDRIRSVNSCSINGVKYVNGQEVAGYKDGYTCNCSDGQIVCTIVAQLEVKPEVNQFSRDNLKVTAKYLIAGTTDNLALTNLGTKFTSVSSKSNTLEITIDQQQKCSVDGRIPVQIGMYYFSKDKLYLTDIVNKDPNVYTQDCVVSINYKISNWKKTSENLSIVYMNEDGQEEKASLCYYNSNIYADGDIYTSVDSCNICKCSQGISKCSNDRVCAK